MRAIEKYISLYIGCDAIKIGEEGVKKNLGLYYPPLYLEAGNVEALGINLYNTESKKVYVANFNQVKPILRHIQSITDKEIVEIWRLIFKCAPSHIGDAREHIENHMDDEMGAEIFAWAVGKYFDLFGLIENDLAIDAALPSEDAGAN